MAKYIGETFRIRAILTDIDTGYPVTVTSCTVTIWPPTAVPGTPGQPTVVLNAAMTPSALTPGAYDYFWNSTGQPTSGVFVYKVTATGANYTSWEFGQVITSDNRLS